MQNANQSLEKLLKELCNYTGLSTFDMTVNESFSDYGMYLVLSRKIDRIDLSDDTKRVAEKVLKPIIEAIQESNAVKDRVGKLEQDLNEAKAEVERLKPFETYYNLEYNMRNGNK